MVKIKNHEHEILNGVKYDGMWRLVNALDHVVRERTKLHLSQNAKQLQEVGYCSSIQSNHPLFTDENIVSE